MVVTNKVLAQSAEMGALPILYAATCPSLVGGTYVGPDGIGEQRGHPEPVGSSAAAREGERRSAVGGLGGAHGCELRELVAAVIWLLNARSSNRLASSHG